MKLRRATCWLAAMAVWGAAGAAGATAIVGGGLAQSHACPSGSSPCSDAANFQLDPPTPVKATTGAIDFLGGTANITLNVPSFTMTGLSGAVTALDFSAVSYSASVSITTLPLGGGLALIQQTPGAAIGSVSGSYTQVGGPGSGPFSDLAVSFSNLSCLLQDGQGTCGLTVGSFTQTADFGLDVDGTDHDVVQQFNVVVPEPGSLALLGLGILALVGRPHRRRAGS